MDAVLKAYEAYDYREAVKLILEISSLGNKYLQDNEPWKMIKQDKDRCLEVMTLAANITKNLSILLQPIMPSFTLKVQKQLDIESLSLADLNFKLANHKINKGRILLTPLEETPSLVAEMFPASLKVAEIE